MSHDRSDRIELMGLEASPAYLNLPYLTLSCLLRELIYYFTLLVWSGGWDSGFGMDD